MTYHDIVSTQLRKREEFMIELRKLAVLGFQHDWEMVERMIEEFGYAPLFVASIYWYCHQ